MREFAFAYWWLIFPAMWFVFGIVGMALAHQRERARLDLMKTYAEKLTLCFRTKKFPTVLSIPPRI